MDISQMMMMMTMTTMMMTTMMMTMMMTMITIIVIIMMIIVIYVLIHKANTEERHRGLSVAIFAIWPPTPPDSLHLSSHGPSPLLFWFPVGSSAWVLLACMSLAFCKQGQSTYIFFSLPVTGWAASQFARGALQWIFCLAKRYADFF